MRGVGNDYVIITVLS